MVKEKVMVMFLLLGIIVTPVFAQDSVTNAVSANTESSSADMTALANEGVTVTQPGNVSLDFRDADIKNVFKILSFKSGVNIVASPEVSGMVTIQLTDVPWGQALDVILQSYGYASEKRGNIILVTTVENLKKRREVALVLAEQEPVVTKSFPLSFGKASEVIASVEKMKSDRGSVNFDERTNTVIVTDIESKTVLMEEVIAKLDTTTPQVLIEAKIVETTLNDKENLGIDWTVKTTTAGAKRPITYPFQGRASTSTKYTPDAFPAAEDDEFKFGTLDFAQFQAVLELLKTRTDTNILSNPRIVTLDNREATIEVGTQHPIPKYGANSETGTLQVIDLQWINIGINFKVTPHVNNERFVTLDVTPEVSELAGAVSFENINVPLIGTEATHTSVIVETGSTLVIAGLLTDRTTKIRKKIPFLGSIPLLGYAFQKSEDSSVKRDLLIFITPHITTPKMDES